MPIYNTIPVTVLHRNGGYTFRTRFNLDYIPLESISVNLAKIVCEMGNAVDYSDLVITAYYQNGTTRDITNDCVIIPSEGSIITEETAAEISYQGLSCSFMIVFSAITLEITVPPDKILYVVGESVDYTGIVVSVVYDDGTRHNVTAYCDFVPAQGSAITAGTTQALISCAPPLETYVYDLNNGYIASGSWVYENPTGVYIDMYSVIAGHTYLLAVAAVVGTRFRAMFTTTDLSELTSGSVAGTTIINADNPEANASVVYTVPSNGYIAVAKDNAGVSGLKSYLYDTSAERTEIINQSLNVIRLVSIIVTTNPAKTAYFAGEIIDYSGLVVTGTYSNGSTRDVTSSCTITPIERKSFNPSTDTNVNISFEGLSTSLTLEEIPLH